MEISIKKLRDCDAEELYLFEKENRLFFEKMVPRRGEEYYELEIFKKKHHDLLLEQEEGKLRFYIIRNNEGDIIGRINLFDIMDQAAEVGFRVGQRYTGRGVARKALKLLMESEVEEKIIRGKTTTNNIASQKVFIRNGFKQIGDKQKPFEFNGQKTSFINYVWEGSKV